MKTNAHYFSFILCLASHLRAQQPNLYAASAPASVRAQNPDLDKLLDKQFTTNTLQGKFTGVNGTKFTSFAKSGHQEDGIYISISMRHLKL